MSVDSKKTDSLKKLSPTPFRTPTVLGSGQALMISTVRDGLLLHGGLPGTEMDEGTMFSPLPCVHGSLTQTLPSPPRRKTQLQPKQINGQYKDDCHCYSLHDSIINDMLVRFTRLFMCSGSDAGSGDLTQ